MLKSKKIRSIKALTMGAFISLGCNGAEFEGDDKENYAFQQSRAKDGERAKLTDVQKHMLSEYKAKYAKEIDHRRNMISEPRLYDLAVESEDRVINRLGNAHTLGVRAQIQLVNASHEQKDRIREYIQSRQWGMRFVPLVSYGNEDKMTEMEAAPVLHTNSPLVKAKDETREDKDMGEDEKDLKSKKEIDDEDEFEEDLKPFKDKLKRSHFAKGGSPNMLGKQKAARGIYYPLFTELDPNNGQKGVLAPISSNQLSWGASAALKGFDNLNHANLGAAGHRHHQESLRKIQYFCGKRLGA